MTKKNWNSDKPINNSDISINEVYRVLEVGNILRSVLSLQELEQLQGLLVEHQKKSTHQPSSLKDNRMGEIGNTGVT